MHTARLFAQAIDAIITGVQPRPPVPPEIAAVVAGFEAWYSSSGIRFAPAGDTMVYSRLHGYAGAADCIGYRLDGSAIVVCDFKTCVAVLEPSQVDWCGTLRRPSSFLRFATLQVELDAAELRLSGAVATSVW